MRHCIKLTLAAVMAGVMSSCELETSGNGDLDGLWRLVSVDTLSTGGAKDMSGTRLYWAFQNKLLELDDKEGFHKSVILRFELGGGQLRLREPYLYDRENGDEALNGTELLAPFGINSMEESFNVERLDGSRMTLSTEDLRLGFKKF